MAARSALAADSAMAAPASFSPPASRESDAVSSTSASAYAETRSSGPIWARAVPRPTYICASEARMPASSSASISPFSSSSAATIPRWKHFTASTRGAPASSIADPKLAQASHLDSSARTTSRYRLAASRRRALASPPGPAFDWSKEARLWAASTWKNALSAASGSAPQAPRAAAVSGGVAPDAGRADSMCAMASSKSSESKRKRSGAEGSARAGGAASPSRVRANGTCRSRAMASSSSLMEPSHCSRACATLACASSSSSASGERFCIRSPSQSTTLAIWARSGAVCASSGGTPRGRATRPEPADSPARSAAMGRVDSQASLSKAADRRATRRGARRADAARRCGDEDPPCGASKATAVEAVSKTHTRSIARRSSLRLCCKTQASTGKPRRAVLQLF
mmetsp:Transcript_30803/g.106487  ORF Transcript_30803/g.106487 Transcript_30803/m.106487 type:complete len:398 (-) Transcript_30803:8-1201(-)